MTFRFISARYVVGMTQYPVAVVMATPCTVLTETRIPTVPDAAAASTEIGTDIRAQ